MEETDNKVTGKRKEVEVSAVEEEFPSTSKKATATETCSNKKIEVQPYLYFNGNAKEAVEFYVKTFGGEMQMMKTFGQGPTAVEEAWRDKVMHAAFSLGRGGPVVMVSDEYKERDSFVIGNNVHLSVSIQGDEELSQVFQALSEGGKVTMPLAKQFWGSTFGSLVDQFGVHWMLSGAYDHKK